MFVVTTVGWFSNDHISNGHILLLQKCLYISLSSFLKETQSVLFLSPKKLSLFIPIKKTYFCESKSFYVQKVRGFFRCTRSKPMGCRILGEERNQILLRVQWAIFSLRITFTRFNPGYIFLPLIYFFVYCML